MRDNRKLGVDLGGTKIEVVLLDPAGNTLHRERCPTPQGDYSATLNSLASLLYAADKKHSIAELPLGLGTPGSVSGFTGLMKNCNSTCLNGQALQQDLEQLLNRPVRLANDADCFALAETRSGAAQGARNVFGVILGTGVGAGLVINGQLLQGPNHISGEWGHNPLAYHNLFNNDPVSPRILGRYAIKRPCYCGHSDCVEAWLSGPGASHSDWELGGKTHQRSAEQIASARNAGEPQAIQVVEDYLQLLALALSNVINILDPDTIVIGGGLSKLDGLYDELPKALAPYIFSDQVLTRIVAAEQGDSAGVFGAAHLWS